LKLTGFPGTAAAISDETAFGADNDVAKLKIESGLSAANRLGVGFAVTWCMKRGEEAYFVTAY